MGTRSKPAQCETPRGRPGMTCKSAAAQPRAHVSNCKHLALFLLLLFCLGRYGERVVSASLGGELLTELGVSDVPVAATIGAAL